jgi:hypothetical protein
LTASTLRTCSNYPLRPEAFTLQDVITKLEPDLFLTVTGLTVSDFHLLVRLKVFNTEQMNQAVFAFRCYEDASLRYTGIESHEGLTHYGLYDTVVAKELIDTPWHGSSPALFVYGGGAARHFASAWLFHRGSHLEATPTDRLGIMTQCQ